MSSPVINVILPAELELLVMKNGTRTIFFF